MEPNANPPRSSDPLVLHMLVLTFSTGLVDALSVLSLGQVFTANMTGNVVFLGFALAGSRQFSATLCAVSLLAFLTGATLSSRLTHTNPTLTPSQLILRSAAFESLPQLAVLALLLAGFSLHEINGVTILAVACMATAMGARNAIARKLAVPDLTTTVLTLTLTGIAADSSAAGGTSPRLPRRLGAVAAMFSGALLGAFLLASHWQREIVIFNVVICATSALYTSRLLRSRNPAA